VGRGVAARIPNSELVLLDGESLLPYVGDMEAVTGAIDAFLGIPVPETSTPRTDAPPPAASLATILFTDVEGSTALTQRLGDAAAREVLREHERITREALRAYGGSEVKTMGDGFMASFSSATRALECAIAIQRNMEQGTGNMNAVRVRIGLNAGEPIAEDDPEGRGDLHGTAVITAARIASLASGGEILVSDVVRQLVAGKGFLFSDRGDHALKGFEDPVRVYEVRWRASEAS
jgi:class 3 adenylate cyclase